MKETPVNKIMENTLEKMRQMVDTSTIIGEPMVTGTTTLIPVSKVSYGFTSGGTDLPSKQNQELFGGGGGGGITITPVAFLVIDKMGNVDIKHITAFDNAAERMVSLVPEMFDKVNVAINKAKMDKAFNNAVADIAVTAEECAE